MNSYLKKKYYNLDSSSSFSSIENLYQRAKRDYPKIKKSDVKNWLIKQETYNLHRNPQRKFKRSSFVSSEIDRFWSIDLIDMSFYSKYNNNFKFILVAIDNFSKYAFLEPIFDKKAKSIVKAFRNIFKSGRKPKIIISDAGTEFNNIIFKNFLLKNKIKLYLMRNTEVKASIAERFIRTIKEKINKYTYSQNSNRFVHVLPKILNNYNNTVHSTTLLKPIEINQNNKNIVLINSTRFRALNQISRLKIGDKVRILKLKGKFEKGYKNSWTKEIFIIKKKLSTVPLTRFKLEDSKQQPILGSFYEKELLRVN